MIVGGGWALVGLLVVGLAAIALVPGCGLVVVDEAPAGQVRLDAPPLVDADPVVGATPAGVWTVSRSRTLRRARNGLLRVTTRDCKGRPSGSGFALGGRILLAQRDVLPGASTLGVAPRKGRARQVRASRVFRLGELAVARVGGRLPRGLPVADDVSSGASVAVVGYPLSPGPRLLRGVVVDRVPGAPFGVHGPVLRLSPALPDGRPGGPVVDAKGRIVAVAFTTDPRTEFAVAVPVGTLRALAAAGTLDVLEPCER